MVPDLQQLLRLCPLPGFGVLAFYLGRFEGRGIHLLMPEAKSGVALLPAGLLETGHRETEARGYWTLAISLEFKGWASRPCP